MNKLYKIYSTLLSVLVYLFFVYFECSTCLKLKFGEVPLEQSANETLEKINKYYEKLYIRLHSGDYGLVGFGEKCETIGVNEFEDFLDLAKEIIKDQDEDGEYRRSVEEHLRPKLRAFYYRSKSFCDFRRLLICDEQSKRCGCAHSSMGIGRNGTCQVNIGKRCIFTQQQLTDLGILILPREIINVSCVGEAECVESFGASAKICKCPTGFWGTSCKTSVFSHSGGKGRSFFAQTAIGRSFWEPDKTDDKTDYFLYPEEIQQELIKMMNYRKFFEADEREKEAHELYTKMEADIDKEEMVTRDIYIRRAARLNYGEPCDPKKQITLDNPPLAKEGDMWVDPKTQDVKKWQLSLLVDGQPFCNYIEFLKCDDLTKVCQCKRGLSLEDQSCRAIVGQSCGSDYDGTFEFDPLRDQKRWSSPYSPTCITGAVCEAKPLFFIKQCWCASGTSCDPNSVDNLTPTDLASDVNARFTLNLEEKCDPDAHALLLNPTESHRLDYKQTISSLQKLLAVEPEVNFCNLEKYYNCTISGKCQCWDNMIEEGGQCRVKNLDSCGNNYIYGDFYPSGTKIWKVEEVFQKKFSPQCIKAAKCGSETIAGKCVCKNGKAGELCTDPRSVFAVVLLPSNVKDYNKDKDINRVFYILNYYTYKVEELMTLKYNDKCDPVAGAMLERIVKFYKQVGSSDETISSSLTFHRYNKAAKWTQYLLRTGVAELCNAFLGLYCHKTSEKCHCTKGYIYEDKICKLNVNEKCEQKPIVSWIPICRNNTECIPGPNLELSCQCKSGFVADFCSDNKTLNDTDKHKEPECANNGVDCHNLRIMTTIFGFNEEVTEKVTEKPEDYFTLIDELLKEIINHRNLSLDKKCETESEKQLTHLFPHLPRFDLEHLPEGPKVTYSKLRVIYNAGFSFCDRKKYYICIKGKCECGDGYGMVRDGDVCRLKEFSFCGEIGTAYDKSLPIPICAKGMKCSKVDFGLNRCIHIPHSDEHM